MKKKVIICLIAVVLVLAICIGLWAQWFFSPGVHTFWRFANFDISERKCYIVDWDTEEIIGQSTMTIRGLDYNNRKGVSSRDDIEVKVEGYTQIIQGRRDEAPFAIRNDDGWMVHYKEYEYVFDETGLHTVDDNHITVLIEFGTVEPDDIIASITTRLNGESQGTVYAVCAESEAAALELFRAYKNSILARHKISR